MGLLKKITYASLGLSLLSAVIDHGKDSPSAEAESALATLAGVLGDKALDGADPARRNGVPAQPGIADLGQ